MNDGSARPPDNGSSQKDSAPQKPVTPKVSNPTTPLNTHAVSEHLAADRPEDAMKALATDTTLPKTPETSAQDSLGLSPYTVRVYDDDGVLDQVRSDQSTAAVRVRNQSLAQHRLEQHRPYDFEERLNQELADFIPAMNTAIRSALQKKLGSIGLSDYVARVSSLQPHFVESILRRVGSMDASGSVDSQTGLILVQPFPSGYPLETFLITAHEMGHASTGLTVVLDKGQDFIYGLERKSSVEGYHQGRLLENAFAELDATDAYAEIQDNPVMRNEVAERRRTIEQNDVQAIQRARKRGDTYEVSWRTRLLAAKRLGIPSTLVEPFAENAKRLDQVVAVWKLSRIIGSQLPNLDPQRASDSEYLFQQGRALLERSRYTGSLDAFAAIRDIFGDQADTIINADEHPDSLDNVLQLLLNEEQARGLSGATPSSEEEFAFY